LKIWSIEVLSFIIAKICNKLRDKKLCIVCKIFVVVCLISINLRAQYDEKAINGVIGAITFEKYIKIKVKITNYPLQILEKELNCHN